MLRKASFPGFPMDTDPSTTCFESSLYGIEAIPSQNKGGHLKVFVHVSKISQKGSKKNSAPNKNCTHLLILRILIR